MQIRGDLLQGDKVVDSIISGSWLHHVEWAKGARGGKVKRVWEAAGSPVQAPLAVDKPLPSDSRFREDLLSLQVPPGCRPSDTATCKAIW